MFTKTRARCFLKSGGLTLNSCYLIFGGWLAAQHHLKKQVPVLIHLKRNKKRLIFPFIMTLFTSGLQKLEQREHKLTT